MFDKTELEPKESASELKPCPFCGGEATLVKASRPDGNVSYDVAYVECDSCKCRTADFITNGYYGVKTTVRDAIKSWNRRDIQTTGETRNKYRDFTDDMRTLYESFCESGFTEEQAIELTGNVMSVSFGLQTLSQRPHRDMTTRERRKVLEEYIKKQKEREEQNNV